MGQGGVRRQSPVFVATATGVRLDIALLAGSSCCKSSPVVAIR